MDFQVSGSEGSWLITTTILSLAGSAFAGATVGFTAGTAVGAALAADLGASLAGADAAGAAAAGADAAGSAEAESSDPPQATTKAESSINDNDIKIKFLMPFFRV